MGEFRPSEQGYSQLTFGTVGDVTSVRLTEPDGRVTTVAMTPSTADQMNIALVTFATRQVAGVTLDGQSAQGSFHCDVNNQNDDVLDCTSVRPAPPTTS